MQRLPTILTALIVVVSISLFMVTYTTQFNEVSVLTTFGGVRGESGQGSDADSPSKAIKSEPGLYFKLPFAQNVITYDKRGRFIQTRSTTVQTADSSQIILEVFAMWRVEDPLTFLRRFNNAGVSEDDHYEAAESELKSMLATAIGETSKYTVSDLFSTEAGSSKIPELEARILESVQAQVRTQISSSAETDAASGTASAGLGIAVDLVGVNRILLSKDTTGKVMERMAASRRRLAQELKQQGEAEATAITSQAEADAKKILAFTERLASQIRASGIREAAVYLEEQNQQPELAVFLRNLEMMRGTLAQRMTLIMSEDDFGFRVFSPDFVSEVPAGELPIQFDDVGFENNLHDRYEDGPEDKYEDEHEDANRGTGSAGPRTSDSGSDSNSGSGSNSDETQVSGRMPR